MNEKTNGWPKKKDGQNMKLGEMTPEQQREQFKKSAARLQTEFQKPEVQAGIAAVLSSQTRMQS